MEIIMIDLLNQNLFTRHELKFNGSGSFKILMLSDLQETLNYDTRTLLSIEGIIEGEKPDLVMLGGDNINGCVLKTKNELYEYLSIFTKPMEARGIPWAHVFGNHDHDMEVRAEEQQLIYESFKYCVSKHTGGGITGTTNYVLPIKHSKNNKIAFNVWALDTNNLCADTLLPYEEFELPDKPATLSCWDIVHFDQLMWYWNSSVQLDAYNGSKINAMMVMHIAPWEFGMIKANPNETGANGSMVEALGLGAVNSGLFATVLQRGDVRLIACGHTHKNSFEGTYCGIKMCYDACAGFSPYGLDDIRGGRVFVLDEHRTSQIKTYMVHAKDYL
jgi:predicted phosphodiesterase